VDFELTEEQKMIQRLAHDFVTDQMKPLERDLLGRAADQSDAKACLDKDIEARLVKTAREAGLWGVNVPEEMGGSGLDVTSNCLIAEELAQTIVPFTCGDVTPLLFEVNETQRQKYLATAANNELEVYVALAEPGADIMPKFRTKAERKGPGYILNGRKIGRGKPGEKFAAIIFAAMGVEQRPTCFIVDYEKRGLRIEFTGGDKFSCRRDFCLTLENVEVEEEDRLGAEGQAFSLAKKWLPARRITRAARVAGVCRRLLEETIVRTQTWQSFGHSAVELPATRTALSEIATEIKACRLLIYEAAWKADRGDNVNQAAATARLFAENTLRNTTNKAALIYGGPPDTESLKAAKRAAGFRVTESLRYIIARNLVMGLYEI
jgi:acyl-CoA dehydrogenase